MSIYISDSIYAAVPLPLDSKTSNIVPQGPNTKIESVTEYLVRVDIFSRHLGLIVAMSHPDGLYENNDLRQKIADGDISVTLYAFISGIEDEDFLPWCPTCDPPIIETRWVSDGQTVCTIGEDGYNTGEATIPMKEEKRIDAGEWYPTGQTRVDVVFNTILCPLPETFTRWIETGSECLLSGGYNSGFKRIYKKEQTKTEQEEWIDTGNTTYVDLYDVDNCPLPQYRTVYGDWYCVTESGLNSGYKTRTATREKSADGMTWVLDSALPDEISYDTTLCPVVPYGLWASTDFSNYDTNNEISINFVFGEETYFLSPVKDDYVYLFLSIPAGKTFVINNAMGVNITSSFSLVSTDNRPGYRNNNIYRNNAVFDGLNPTGFSIKIS